jgi:diguanylate cyclase (GGDEF)-like protein
MVTAAAPSNRPATAGAVMILSEWHGEELGARLRELDWVPSMANDAHVIMVDLRDTAQAARSGIDKALAVRKPLVILYTPDQSGALPAMAEQGVRHFLRLPFDDAELLAVLTSAAGRVTPDRRAFLRDALTGLPQASDLREWLTKRTDRGPLTLLLINMTRFDAINAALGREAGDALLKATARRIEPIVAELTGPERIIARMAGAEFAVGISGIVSSDRLYMLAEAIVDSLARPLPSAEGPVSVGTRIVVVDQPAGGKSSTVLIRRASRLLGEIRDGDSGPILLATGAQGETQELSRSLHADLRAALASDEIDVLFQPQVGVTGGFIEGVEALARWRHPVRGEIGAATLFAVAAQSNYSLELSAHIQKLALTMAAAWPQKLSHLRLAINVTAADLARPHFFRGFEAMIAQSGFPKERLTIEVTESALMHSLEAAAKVLAQFRAFGCRVAIDDFGTGYSSLAWLKSLPADYLKIDQGLAGEIMGEERDSVVLRGVIGMARSLGLTVIAEGIETEGQLALLAREGCALYQGFLCAPPLDVAGLEQLINQRG